MDEGFNHWNAIAVQLGTATKQAVKKAAFDIQGGAQVRAAVDTGFMKNSIYVSTFDETTYGQGAGSPPKGAELLPEVKPDDGHTAIIGVGASYGLYVEMGTVRMPAQPYLMPAVESVRPGFEAALGKIEEKLKEVRG
jgi:HK97 gp10 family phage protein